MQNKTEKLAKNAMIYGFFGLLQKGLGFFLLPIYASILDVDQLGIISTSTAVIAFFVIFFGLSLRGSTAYHYYKHKSDNPEFVKRFFGTNFSFILLFTIVGILLLLVCKKWILDFVFENIPFKPYVLLSLISVLFQPIYLFYQSILKAKHLAKQASTLDFLFFGAMVSLTTILIVFFGFKAEGALLANAFASFLVFVISIVGIRKEITFCLDFSILRKSLKYSLPLLPHNLSGWTMNMADKLMLNGIDSLRAVALFDVGAQMGKLVSLISLGVNSAYSPWFFEQVRSHPKDKGVIVSVTNKIVLLYAVVAVSISWMAPEILEIISKPDYHESWKVVPFIATAFVLNGFYFTYSNVFFLEKTKYLPFLTITGASTNLALNYILIPRFGFYGAAYASLVSKILFTTLTYFFCQRLYAIPYKIYYLLIVFIGSFVLSCLPLLVQKYFDHVSLVNSIMLKSLILICIFIPIVLTNLASIKQLIKTKS